MKMTRISSSEFKTIYIVGPTASGKTALAIEVAKKLHGEVICADSQTIRRSMDIGTAKPTAKEMDGVPHHLLDIIDPYEEYSLAKFKNTAMHILNDIHMRKKVAIIVGGTGLYIDSLFFNYHLPEISDNREDYGGYGVDELRSLITSRGLKLPINENNPRHLVNVLKRGGEVGAREEPKPDSIIVGIKPPREVLIERINQRVEQMFAQGFVDEVKAILKKYGRPPREFDAIGYKIVVRMLDGEVSQPEAMELFKTADRQYAKRQLSWLNRNEYIEWFASPEQAKAYILSKS